MLHRGSPVAPTGGGGIPGGLKTKKFLPLYDTYACVILVTDQQCLYVGCTDLPGRSTQAARGSKSYLLGGGGFPVGGGGLDSLFMVGLTGTMGFSVSVDGTGGQTRFSNLTIGLLDSPHKMADSVVGEVLDFRPPRAG